MAQTYNVQIEDSAGNKYCPKPDLLTTQEQLAANNAAGKSVDALVVKAINNNLGGFRFRSNNGFKQVSIDGGSSWENFCKALSSFRQGENRWNNAGSTLKITANIDYKLAFLVVSGFDVNISSISTSGSGTIRELQSSNSKIGIHGFIIENIKSNDTITIKTSTTARFIYAIWD